MSSANWNLGRRIQSKMSSGLDPKIIHRNFQHLVLLIEALEDIIPFFEESIPAGSLLVQDGTSSRKFVDSGVTIDKDTQAMAGVGAFTAGGVATFNGTFAGSAFLDEDDFASNAADKVASQQSTKAYVDSLEREDSFCFLAPAAPLAF